MNPYTKKTDKMGKRLPWLLVNSHGLASQVLFSIAIVPMLLFLTRSNTTLGYFYTTGILTVIQVIGYWNLFYQTRDYEKYDLHKKLTRSHNLTVPEIKILVVRLFRILKCRKF